MFSSAAYLFYRSGGGLAPILPRRTTFTPGSCRRTLTALAMKDWSGRSPLSLPVGVGGWKSMVAADRARSAAFPSLCVALLCAECVDWTGNHLNNRRSKYRNSPPYIYIYALFLLETDKRSAKNTYFKTTNRGTHVETKSLVHVHSLPLLQNS